MSDPLEKLVGLYAETREDEQMIRLLAADIAKKAIAERDARARNASRLVTHGRENTYAAGCRCEECHAAKRDHDRRYQERRRLGLPPLTPQESAQRGIPVIQSAAKQAERQERQKTEFMARVQVDESGCWNWHGHLDDEGYGHFGKHMAHRLAYRIFVGDIPVGFHLDHLCRVRHCVNPAHLEAVSPSENSRRAAAGCANGHVTAEGKRTCLVCGRFVAARLAA